MISLIRVNLPSRSTSIDLHLHQYAPIEWLCNAKTHDSTHRVNNTHSRSLSLLHARTHACLCSIHCSLFQTEIWETVKKITREVELNQDGVCRVYKYNTRLYHPHQHGVNEMHETTRNNPNPVRVLSLQMTINVKYFCPVVRKMWKLLEIEPTGQKKTNKTYTSKKILWCWITACCHLLADRGTVTPLLLWLVKLNAGR